MPFPIHPRLGQIYRQVRASTKLAQISDDPIALQTKIALDASTFALIKQAGPWFAKLMQNPVARGAAYGLGAAIPAAAGGAYLIHRGGEQAKETSADLRNKILQSALGAAGIGAGLYGLHRLTGGGPLFSINTGRGEGEGEGKGEGRGAEEPKQAAARDVVDELPDDMYHKLAAIMAIECALDDVQNAPAETQKLATEMRILNHGYGVQLLYELCHP